jgi:hypothetical protein
MIYHQSFSNRVSGGDLLHWLRDTLRSIVIASWVHVLYKGKAAMAI